MNALTKAYASQGVGFGVKSGLRAASYRNDVMNVTSSILVDARHSLRELFKSLQNHPLPSLPYVRKGDYGAFPLTYERKTADVLRRFIIPACFSLLFLFSRRYAPVPLALFCGILFQAISGHLRPSVKSDASYGRRIGYNTPKTCCNVTTFLITTQPQHDNSKHNFL